MNTINSLSRRHFLHLSAGACGTLGLTSLGLGLSMPSGAAPTKPAVPAPFDTIALSEIIKKAIANQASPGIAVAAWQNGQEVFALQQGYANLELRSAVQAESVFRIGSLSKQFTAAMLLKLAEAKTVRLDMPVKHYLPFFGPKENFSLRELLQHTAGIHDADVDPRQLKVSSQIDLARIIAKQKPFFDFAPGSAWLYSNSNYFLAGAVIEKVTGKSLQESGDELLFKPLQLKKTRFDDPKRVLEQRVAGYSMQESDGAFVNADYEDIVLNGAAGGMVSTASDLCRWHQALFNGDVLSRDSLEQMLAGGLLRNRRKANTNRFSPNDKMMGNVDYGLGLLIDHESTSDQSAIVHHHGGVMGFAAMLVSHPNSRLSYAVLCNADSNPKLPFRDIRRTVLASVLKK